MKMCSGRVVAVMTALALGVTACSSPPPPLEKPASPEPRPSVAAPNAGDVLWRTRDYDGPVEDVTKVGGGYVVTTTVATERFDSQGQHEWIVDEPARRSLGTSMVTVGAVVVRSSMPEANRDGTAYARHLRILDGTSGRLLWQDDVDEYLVTSRAIYTASCTERRTKVMEGCTAIAREPTTGRMRWHQATPAGLGGLDLVGDSVQVTSFPFGTDRTEGPYLERTVVQILDAQTGARRGPELLGNDFRPAGRTLIEASYTGSVGPACEVVLVARRLDGRELWSRTFDWTLLKEDHDCALAIDVDPLPDGRIDIGSTDRFGLVVDASTGRTLWDRGPRRLVLASRDGVDVVTDRGFTTFRGLDVRTHRERWRVTGELAGDPGAGYLGFATGTTDETELRSIRTGEVSLVVNGSATSSGDDWVAVEVPSPGGSHIDVVHWPH